MRQLEDLLQKCTVKLTCHGSTGTGFFVSPGLIITCAHVVQHASEKTIKVRWQNEENWAEAIVVKSLPDPYDLALLRVPLFEDSMSHCVSLDTTTIQSRDFLYLFGYPDNDFPNGCPATVNCEGLTGDKPSFIKFSSGQVRPGMSGSPLLNQRTGDVCGIVKFTRDRYSDLGGGAVCSTTILAQFPELIEQQRLFHQQDRRWNNLVGELFDDEKVMVQNNSDDTIGYQTKTGSNNTNYIGGEHHHHHNNSSKVEQRVKKILMLSANPANTESARKRTSVKDIRDALKRSSHGQLLDLQERLETSAIDISQELSEINPFIVNISGCEKGIELLTLEISPDGNLFTKPEKIIADLFKPHTENLECIILNSCYSPNQSAEIIQHVEFVIGITQDLKDSEVILFLSDFYYHIGSRKTIKDSYSRSYNLLERKGVNPVQLPILLNRHDERKRKGLESELIICNSRIEEDNNNIELWAKKADLLGKLGRFDEADKIYEKASAIQPKNPEIRIRQGNTLDQSGNHTEAIIAYDKALELEKDDYILWWKRGKSLIKIKKYAEAAMSYKRAVLLKPPSPDSYVIFREYGFLQKELGEYSESIILYKNSLAVEPKYRLSSYEKRRVYKKMYSDN